MKDDEGEEMPEVETKADFAARLGVTPQAVSKYLKKGQLSGAALQGVGRRAKIRVAVALDQLKRRLDVAQRMANGRAEIAATPMRDPAQRPIPGAAKSTSADDDDSDVIDQMQAEKLRSLQMVNRKLEEEEQERRGMYCRTDQVQGAMASVATMTISAIEGALPDLAAALAEQFALPQRDILHALRGEVRKVRLSAAERLRQSAAAMERLMFDGQKLSESLAIERQGDTAAIVKE